MTERNGAWLRGGDISALRGEFPTLSFEHPADRVAASDLRASQWRGGGFDTWGFDCEIDRRGAQSFALGLTDDLDLGLPFVLEVVTRCQRAIGRRNRYSSDGRFDSALRAHRALHDLDRPLVRADYNHALDVWQWLLRMEPEASMELQLAALFHDIERLVSEADRRVEQLAPDYQHFKDGHARGGAAMAVQVLRDAGLGNPAAGRVAELIARHEHASEERELALLGDADALSFFSLNSCGYADYFGPGQTRKKVVWTWARMSAPARLRMADIHLRADVRALVDRIIKNERRPGDAVVTSPD
ncbi:MAG: hypothetical protein JWN02_2317 [Acidobacteria bacterium]|nr:hypothetical protein [Acidobacteriota bacterium]